MEEITSKLVTIGKDSSFYESTVYFCMWDNYDSFAPGAKNQELSMNIKNLVNDAYAKEISANSGCQRIHRKMVNMWDLQLHNSGYRVEKRRNGIYS